MWCVRFVGACVEDLARKHYAQLLDYEQKANDANLYHALCNLDSVTSSHAPIDQTVLYTLTVYVSVLRSDNARCANSIYSILRHMWERLNAKIESCNAAGSQLPIDGQLADDLVLLVTMATLHPAFEFSQRVELFRMLLHVREVLTDCGLVTTVSRACF